MDVEDIGYGEWLEMIERGIWESYMQSIGAHTKEETEA